MAPSTPFDDPRLGTFHGGAIPSAPDARDFLYPRFTHMPAGLRTNNDLRNFRGQSLSMPVGDQQQIGSCTSWAWGYYLRGALAARWHVENGTKPDLPDTLAPRFIYDMERSAAYMGTYPQDSGADMRSGAKVLLDYGVPPERDCPYTGRADNGPVEQELTQHMKDAAAYYAVSGYYRLQGQGATLIDSIIQCLAEGYPVAAAVLVPQSFEDADARGRMAAPRSDDVILGEHAICLMADYIDTSMPGGGSFPFPNQWGTGWGEAGWAYLPFAYATTLHRQYGYFLQEAWTAR